MTSDPFAGLTPPDDVSIDPAFAARLRTRVQRALGVSVNDVVVELPDRSTTARNGPAPSTTATTTSPVASSDTERNTTTMAQVITPYVCVHDATAALDWYREYFGANVSNVIPWDGRVGHAELDIAGAVFYLSDEAPDLGVTAPERDGSHSSVSIVIQVAVVDEFVERAARGGAVVQRPIEEAHGSRSAWLVDPFGHRWNVGTPVFDGAAMTARRGPSEPYYMTLTSPDVARGAAFYGAVLGWEFQEQPNGGRHVTNTGMPIGIRSPENPFGDTEPGEIQVWFTARDFDDAVERVRTAGGTVVDLNAYDSGREAICEDDQGVRFKLSEPAPGYDQ